MKKKCALLFVLLLFFCSGCSPPVLFENEQAGVLAEDSEATLPRGFRRTKDGWEDATYWHLGSTYRERSLHAWMGDLKNREPVWMRRLLDRIRQTPPLMVAVIQIAAVAAIFKIHQFQAAQESADAESDSLSSDLSAQMIEREL